MMIRRSRLSLLTIALSLLACTLAVAQKQPPPSLGKAVQDFLSEWLRGNPDAAAQRYLSKFSEARAEVLPQGGEPGERPPNASGRQRLASELRSVRAQFWAGQPAAAMSAPTTTATMGDVMPALRDRKIDPQPLESAQALVFPVRTWEELTFTGTAGPRHRALFEDAASLAKQPYWGVITRLHTAEGRIVPYLLVWHAEGPEAQPTSWKLVTMLQILTD